MSVVFSYSIWEWRECGEKKWCFAEEKKSAWRNACPWLSRTSLGLSGISNFKTMSCFVASKK